MPSATASQLLSWLVLVAALGSAVMAGLLFVFSTVVMTVLRELPHVTGMHVMQRINVVIVNPLFLCFFLGAAAASVAIVFLAGKAPPSARFWLYAAAACYVLGVVGVTLAFNIPLNNLLARTPEAQAAAVWPDYVTRWLSWNHVRAICAVFAVAAWCAALFELGRAVRP